MTYMAMIYSYVGGALMVAGGAMVAGWAGAMFAAGLWLTMAAIA
jgi:hypothetical protein